MKKWICICFVIFSGLGCSDDTAATNPTPDAGNLDAARVLPDTPAPPCEGCFADGTCQRGDEDERCGANGAMCMACGEGQACSEDGTCITVTDCTSENCEGCCSSDGTCLPGNQAEACGVMGQACEACVDGTACNAGRCMGGCGPDNCAGCCNAMGACVGGDADDACGRAGLSCEDCSANGATCGGGACVAESCADTCAGCCDGDICIENTTAMQCGAGGGACVACQGTQTCDAGMCTAPSGSNWDIEIVSADLGFFPWDLWTPGDAFVDVYLVGPTGSVIVVSTSVAADTSTPMWNEKVVTQVPREVFDEGLLIEMYDSDAFGPEFICDWEVVPDQAFFSAPLIESTCRFDSDVKLRWRLTPSP